MVLRLLLGWHLGVWSSWLRRCPVTAEIAGSSPVTPVTMTPVDKAYELLQSQYPDEPPLYVGDTVYYTLLEYPRAPRFVVDAKIVEVQFVISHPTWAKEKSSLWLNIDPRLPNGHELVGPTLPFEHDDLGWAKQGMHDPSLVLDEGVKLGNWFVWVDLPVGHALSPWDEVTPYVDEALSCVRPFRGRVRHAKSALNRYINGGMKFIASTHKKPVSQMGFPNYRRYPDRKIYWRRK